MVWDAVGRRCAIVVSRENRSKEEESKRERSEI
jgi:hypothetical protein